MENDIEDQEHKAKRAQITRTLWWIGSWWWWSFRQGQYLNQGGALLVQCHSVHDAPPKSALVEAYVLQPTAHAACQTQLSEFDVQCILPWHHSIQYECTYLHPFDAVMSAWKLSWNLICDFFDEKIGSILFPCSPVPVTFPESSSACSNCTPESVSPPSFSFL